MVVFQKTFLQKQTVDLRHFANCEYRAHRPLESSLGFILSMIRVTGGYEQVKEGIGLVLFLSPPPAIIGLVLKGLLVAL